MLDFIYNTPTKVYFGRDKQRLVGKIIKELGYNTIMLQYGKESIKKSGLYDEVMRSLSENGIKVIECGGVEPNPKISFVREAVKLAKREGVEFILAVGGGSALDSSKTTALAAKSEYDAWDIQSGKVPILDALPIGCILTHSAAGSEMSASTVITNTETQTKRGITTEFNRCRFAIMNPELTFSVSPYQTACGIVDMLSHTLERYFTVFDTVEITDSVAEGVMRAIIKAGKKAMQNPLDYEARANLMWASSLSHNGLTGCGRQDVFTVHPMEHALSGIYDNITHGAGLAVLYPAWAKYIYKKAIPRFARFARNVWDVTEENDEAAARLGIEAMQDFFVSLGMPSSLSDFGLDASVTEKLAAHCTLNDTIKVKSYIPLGLKEIKEIFDLCV